MQLAIEANHAPNTRALPYMRASLYLHPKQRLHDAEPNRKLQWGQRGPPTMPHPTRLQTDEAPHRKNTDLGHLRAKQRTGWKSRLSQIPNTTMQLSAPLHTEATISSS